jgi:predicted permease
MKFNWFGHRDHELDAEIRSHLDEAIRERLERGESPDEARLNALREFGNVTLVKEVTRDMWGWRWLEHLLQDLRFGLRLLRKNPAFSLISILTLSLGIGANLTIFSFVDTFFLRPLPVPASEQVVNVEASRNGRLSGGSFAYPAYLQYRDYSTSFVALAAHYSTAPLNLAEKGDSRMMNGALVSANYFPMLGIQPRLGRFFLPEEDVVPDRNPVVVISERLWKDRFNNDLDVLGRELQINGVACHIIGVAPAEFSGVLPGEANDLWLPTMMLHMGYRWCDALSDANCRPLQIMGRLAPGRSLPEAETELNLLAEHLAETLPTEQGRVFWLRPALGIRMNERPAYAYQMQLLMSVTGLLLVIACANVASLLLVRAAARRKEIAIRLAIGAGRARLIRQFLTESLLLACVGGGLGLLLSHWGKDLLAAFYNSNGLQYDFSLSSRALGYGFTLALCAGLFSGLLPAWQATDNDLVRGLKDDAASLHPVTIVCVARWSSARWRFRWPW